MLRRLTGQLELFILDSRGSVSASVEGEDTDSCLNEGLEEAFLPEV